MINTYCTVKINTNIIFSPCSCKFCINTYDFIPSLRQLKFLALVLTTGFLVILICSHLNNDFRAESSPRSWKKITILFPPLTLFWIKPKLERWYFVEELLTILLLHVKSQGKRKVECVFCVRVTLNITKYLSKFMPRWKKGFGFLHNETFGAFRYLPSITEIRSQPYTLTISRYTTRFGYLRMVSTKKKSMLIRDSIGKLFKKKMILKFTPF